MIHTPRTRRARVLFASIVAALSIGLTAPLVLPAAVAAATKTKVTFRFFLDNENAADQFVGAVHSHKLRCRAPRKVKLLQKVPGPDVLVGSYRTRRVNGGGWVIHKEDPPDGRYYARVKPKRGCLGDKSGTRTVDDDPQI
jgi:hypothetical protein